MPVDEHPSESDPGAEPVEQSVEQPVAALAAMTQRLDLLQGLPLVEHPDVYQRIHGELQSVLADIDDA